MLGNNVKAARIKYGFSQQDMADYLAISKTTYQYKEVGKIDFWLNEGKKMADLFGTTIDELFFEHEVI